MGWKRVRDSDMVQFVFVREKESVAAAKMEISVVKAGVEVAAELAAELAGVRDGISFGFWVEVFSAGGS